MKKADARRELEFIFACYPKPWDVIPDDQQQRIHELTKIAYPNGIPLPRI